jgi:DNA-directed RNA polymerase specialized sigma24 family protein
MRQALVDAIKNLPEREQYVMSMYYEHDMNLKEIAAVLGSPRAASASCTASRSHAARQAARVVK